MRQITLNRQLLGLEDLLFGTGTVTQNRANQVVTITEINAGNLPFDETRTLVEFAQATNLEELGNSIEAINNLNNNLDKLLIVEDNLPIINNVEAIKESIVTLDTNILALQNIDTNISSINTVEDNLHEVVSVAQNIVPNLTEILNVDTVAAQVTQDKSDVSSMKLLVETIYDTFDARFLGTKIVDPTLDNDGNALIDGAMYFNTSTNTMKVYDVGTTTWYSIPQVYLSALLDVQLTSITSGNVLRWNGTKWINYTLSKSDVELNLVDNTADSAKNVLSATKLANARTINGVSFDGSANITISDSTAVKLTGNQTLDDIKTYTSSPIVPTPTTYTQVANKQYVDDKYSGFKNLIVNGRKQVNQSGLTATDNAYNYDNHYKAGNNWFIFIDGKNIISGEPYTVSWDGAASAGYYIGTSGALTINAQAFTALVNGETITPTITSSQILWIKFASDASGSTYNKVQFEPGTVPTPYEQRLYELERSLVQSYYSESSIYFSNNTVAGNAYGGITMLPVDMRIDPILTLINQVNINGTFGTIGINNSADYAIRGINFYAVASSTTNGAIYKAGAVADARPY